jgi:hypothetical protein
MLALDPNFFYVRGWLPTKLQNWGQLLRQEINTFPTSSWDVEVFPCLSRCGTDFGRLSMETSAQHHHILHKNRSWKSILYLIKSTRRKPLCEDRRARMPQVSETSSCDAVSLMSQVARELIINLLMTSACIKHRRCIYYVCLPARNENCICWNFTVKR